ncbi:hypothetical protein HLB23_28755 [Nocardia uniformis]|uniref:Uncharacterized protein n=1 Tax=Nocardia uniformis TaxID=53432 RepID=A0A849CCK2_9NOCA|nr:hypothetical protein [Nocardia uniformis]NNH73797.1 hypothetical protein [Nocardia uniformis]
MPTNNTMQFARLIAALDAAGAFTDEAITSATASMNLESEDVLELKDRAVHLWNEALALAETTTAVDEVIDIPHRPRSRGGRPGS